MSERVRQAIRDLAKSRQIFTGVASQIDLEAGTCSVSPSDGGPPYFEVAFKPHPSAISYFVPDEQSEVVCAQLTDQYVIVVSCAKPKLVVVEGTNEVQLNAINTEITLSGGVKIEANNQSLKTILVDLLTALQQLAPISAAPGSPCAPNPADITKMQALSTRIQSLLK